MVLKSPQLLGFFTFLMLSALIGTCYGGLQLNYYGKDCPSAEGQVRTITRARVLANPSLAAKLLRLHFHDCFVRGCDASVLLESTSTNQAEKDAGPNLSLGGFEVIAEIKAKIEQQCEGVVSCADIVTLAARDAVSTLNPNATWEVQTGRRDGTVSNATEAIDNLPSPFSDFDTLKNSFESQGLDLLDLVALSGAHTIGITHCTFMLNRLYNFSGKNDTDPSLDPDYANKLKQICPPSVNPLNNVDMDPDSAESFDTSYFSIVKQNKGIFPSDAALLTNIFSYGLVSFMENPNLFFFQFGKSMKKMASIGVLTGTAGEIRRNCSIIN